MTNPNLADDPQAARPASEKSAGWSWPQIGLLSFNIGLFLTATEGLFTLTGVEYPESGKALSGILMLSGLVVAVVSRTFLLAKTHGGEVASHSPRIRWLNWGIFSGTITMTMLSLIIPAVHAGRQAANRERAKQAEAMEPGAWHTIHSAKGQFVLDVPTHWVDSENPEWQENDVAKVDPPNDLLFFVLSVPKEDVTYAGLNAWADAVVDELKASMTESEVIEKTTHERSGRIEIELRLDATNENTRLTFFMRFLETPTHYVWARALAARSGFLEHEETLLRIVQSVRVE